MEDRHERGGHGAADALVHAILSLREAALRASYVATIARGWPAAALARALDALCARAEQADDEAREVLVAVVDALNGEGMDDVVQGLREEAAAGSLLALERLVRSTARSSRSFRVAAVADEAIQAAVDTPRAHGRVLTLGERKYLARRPDRDTMQRMLADPHPDVIRRCLTNPRLTEDDVLRLVARRPGRAEVLSVVARSPWARRLRVRLALVLNPATPLEIATRAAGLLLRHELDLVARSPGVAAPLRAVCLEHLARRPPHEGRPSGPGVH
jgi:hypothetical protein